jgi:hypothetical protein
LFHPAEFGAGEMLPTIVGGVFPMLSVILAVFVLPAASVTVPVITWPAPSVLTVFGGEQLVMAETAAVQVKFTVTLVLFHPAVFADGVADAVMEGRLNSIFIVGVVTVAVFPALSVTVPETVWFVAVAERITGGGQVATPDNESAQVKFTVTFVVFHPAEFAAGVGVATIVGAVSSMFSVAVTDAVSPALLTAVPVTF